MDAWIELVKSAGPVVAAIAFFVWRDAKRETDMTQQLRILEKFIREDLAGMVHDAAKLQVESNVVMGRCELALQHYTGRIDV